MLASEAEGGRRAGQSQGRMVGTDAGVLVQLTVLLSPVAAVVAFVPL